MKKLIIFIILAIIIIFILSQLNNNICAGPYETIPTNSGSVGGNRNGHKLITRQTCYKNDQI